MVRVLFVCLGDICRSHLAQGVFEDVLRREVPTHASSWRVASSRDDCQAFDYVLTIGGSENALLFVLVFRRRSSCQLREVETSNSIESMLFTVTVHRTKYHLPSY